ncbi:phage tail tape measure protein [Perkinsela sp. CCAP 1560/4]|nr:phage tail tape measure protein [Perkinsela sp. CCAP 1560/4]KNH06720.1 phage tail tape measure protein [Perkinsela sp. CCAP 1560/4]|eukprot:KNH06522.1 phage tail tape measure protein [Perkinsela sp. CCAP 1560/4]
MSGLENSNWKRIKTPFADRVLEDTPCEQNEAPNFTSSYPCKLEQADFCVDPSLSYDESLWVTIVGLSGKYALLVVKAVRSFGSVQAIALPREGEANYFYIQFMTPMAVQHALNSRSKFYPVGDIICILAIVPCTDTAFASSHRLGISSSESQLKYSEPSQLPIRLNWLYYFRWVYRFIVVCLYMVWISLRAWFVALIRKSEEHDLHGILRDFAGKGTENLAEKIRTGMAGRKQKCTNYCRNIPASLADYSVILRALLGRLKSQSEVYSDRFKETVRQFLDKLRNFVAAYPVAMKELCGRLKSKSEDSCDQLKERTKHFLDKSRKFVAAYPVAMKELCGRLKSKSEGPWDQLREKIRQFLDKLRNFVATKPVAMKALYGRLKSNSEGSFDQFKERFNRFSDKLKEFFAACPTGLSERCGRLKSESQRHCNQVKEQVSKILEKLREFFAACPTGLSERCGRLKSGSQRYYKQVKKSIQRLFDKLWDFFAAYPVAMAELLTRLKSQSEGYRAQFNERIRPRRKNQTS